MTIYRLDSEIGGGRVPIQCELHEWAMSMRPDSLSRIVAQTHVGMLFVSTVFLAIDHYYGNDPDHPPLLFETMVFDQSVDGQFDDCGRWLWRGSTWEQAHWNHIETVRAIENYTGCQATPAAGDS